MGTFVIFLLIKGYWRNKFRNREFGTYYWAFDFYGFLTMMVKIKRRDESQKNSLIEENGVNNIASLTISSYHFFTLSNKLIIKSINKPIIKSLNCYSRTKICHLSIYVL